MTEHEPQQADSVTSATPGSELPRWSPGDTGLFKKTPQGYIMAGTEAATKLGLEAWVDGWTPFTVAPDGE